MLILMTSHVNKINIINHINMMVFILTSKRCPKNNCVVPLTRKIFVKQTPI